MKILLIRRDNIGDLVCTTPLIRALRQQLPEANIQALVTHYNAAVVRGNPDLDKAHSYQKAKHRKASEGRFSIYWDRFRTILELRSQRFDYVLLPGGNQASSLRFARMVAPRQVLIRDDQDRISGPHEVEQCCHLLSRMGLEYQAPAPIVVPDGDLVAKLRAKMPDNRHKIIGVHISARKISQRWPADRFAQFIAAMDQAGMTCLLLWSPGAADDAKHPGDDAKAQEVIKLAGCSDIVPVPTHHLDELIAAISLCDYFFCSDGGAMHLAAALSKSMVCLFGDSDPERWGPWGNRAEILQTASRDVRDISVGDVLAKFSRVLSA